MDESISSLAKYTPRLGLGSTGLGMVCNEGLDKDIDDYIKVCVPFTRLRSCLTTVMSIALV